MSHYRWWGKLKALQKEGSIYAGYGRMVGIWQVGISFIKIKPCGIPSWCQGLRIVTAVVQVASMVRVLSLAWELPHAADVEKKKKKPYPHFISQSMGGEKICLKYPLILENND